jgi:hypothetical protein
MVVKEEDLQGAIFKLTGHMKNPIWQPSALILFRRLPQNNSLWPQYTFTEQLNLTNHIFALVKESYKVTTILL